MAHDWKKYVKRLFLAGASVFSFFAGGFIVYDLHIRGLSYVRPSTLNFLATALIFMGITMLILVDDLYRVKK